ncbi:Cyclophilin-like domain superfamily [Arabidopsis thaliana x Arabidopsis arenosa]|uniref:peptidylprolyl isomerase n=1 Tax=Arabidopsis thaliana x Arabidopsis arenosa TaxID=1240361 RepID=A0A8T2AWD2_9BRAS|nr:Cyclophilin-like domain superfamily [Arabidopsis thaliana x Arabidopsis arenosa]
MEMSFTIHVPAGCVFTINVKPVVGLVPPAGGGGGGLNVNVHPLAGGVEQVKEEPLIVETPNLFDPSLKMANPKVFFDMSVGGKPAGRIVIELFAHTTPRTAENFRALCTGEKGMGKLGKPLHYKGSIIHRLVPDQMLCGGDITAGDGSGGESIYGDRFFEDENFINKQTGPGILAMANRGIDTNESQFMICMEGSPIIDTEHVVFGHVVEGLDVIKSIDKEVRTGNCVPSKPVIIADCGQIS